MVSPAAVAAGDELWVLWPPRSHPARDGRRVARRVRVLEVRRDGFVYARYDDEPARLFGESTVRRWRRRRPATVG